MTRLAPLLLLGLLGCGGYLPPDAPPDAKCEAMRLAVEDARDVVDSLQPHMTDPDWSKAILIAQIALGVAERAFARRCPAVPADAV